MQKTLYLGMHNEFLDNGKPQIKRYGYQPAFIL